jgi:hypothetical protein
MGVGVGVGVGVMLGGVRGGWGLGIVVRGGLLVNWGCHSGEIGRGGCSGRVQISRGRVRLISLTRRIRD